MTHGKTYNKSPRRITHKATKSKTNTGTIALERSVEQNHCYNIHDGRYSSHLEDLQLSAYAVVNWPWSVRHPYVRQQLFIFDISIRIISMMAAMAAILKVFNCYLFPNRKSGGAETWWKALGQYGDFELLKWFRSDIQDGHHGSHLENLQITSAPER